MVRIERAKVALAEQYPRETELTVVCEVLSAVPPVALTLEDTEILLALLRAIPTGVVAMSQKLQSLVETSNNLGVVNTAQQAVISEPAGRQLTSLLVTAECSSRCSVKASLDDITATLTSVAELAGAETEVGRSYPSWDPNPDSNVLAAVKEAYAKLKEEEPLTVAAVHAGLECGVIADRISGLDAVSFGPTIEGAHSPQERVHIGSVARFYRLLVRVLVDLSVGDSQILVHAPRRHTVSP